MLKCISTFQLKCTLRHLFRFHFPFQTEFIQTRYYITKDLKITKLGNQLTIFSMQIPNSKNTNATTTIFNFSSPEVAFLSELFISSNEVLIWSNELFVRAKCCSSFPSLLWCLTGCSPLKWLRYWSFHMNVSHSPEYIWSNKNHKLPGKTKNQIQQKRKFPTPSFLGHL